LGDYLQANYHTLQAKGAYCIMKWTNVHIWLGVGTLLAGRESSTVHAESHEHRSRKLAVAVASRVLQKSVNDFVTNSIARPQQLMLPPQMQQQSTLHLHRTLEDGSNVECDAAFMECILNDKCVECFLKMQTEGIDWAFVTKETPCDSVLETLYDKTFCLNQRGDEAAEGIFCSTFAACVDTTQEVPEEDDKTIDCSKLTKCDWPGIHLSFLGDGVCHENLEGCYNTAVCNYDGGDCCDDTCSTDSDYKKCGQDGFSCKDPSSAKCDSSLTTGCPISDDDDGAFPLPPQCSDSQAIYRLVMYDSFGDGWDETVLTIRDADTRRSVYTGSLQEGSQGTQLICLSRYAQCYHVDVNGGTWGNEVSWEVKPYTDGTPALAGGSSPMSCDFSVSGGKCEKTCTGRPNIRPADDPEYKEFKEMYTCINEKCPIQVGACQKDEACSNCFVEEAPDYCFGIDTFNAVVDCTLCKCSGVKDSDFCDKKASPGIIIPDADAKPGGDSVKKPCTPAETLKGGQSVIKFSQCTDLDQVGMMVTDFDQSNFGDLDVFEMCAHSFNKDVNHGGRTAQGCMQILANTMNTAARDSNSSEDQRTTAIAALAKFLYTDAKSFCDCAKDASDNCPLCPSFANFKTLLYESLDACQSLDEIDCDAWDEFQKPCKQNLQSTFGTIDFTKEEQCDFVHDNSCGGAGPFPAFRRLDCGDELESTVWNFYLDFAKGCLSDAPPTPVSPTPSPVTPRTAVPVAPAPTPVNPSPYDPSPAQPSDNKKPYVPPEERDKKKSKDAKPDDTSSKKKSHWFRNLFILCLLCGGGYYYYKRRSEFSFVRYRRARNFGGDEDGVYSGLTMESSTSFEPPSLPPTPAAMGNYT
jgi:hypothetical protein